MRKIEAGWSIEDIMRGYTAVIERCPDTGLYVGYVPGFPGAHSQAKTLDELHNNLREVIEMLLEDGTHNCVWYLRSFPGILDLGPSGKRESIRLSSLEEKDISEKKHK